MNKEDKKKMMQSAKRNKQRRERYKKDSDYRDQYKNHTMLKYREAHNVVMTTCAGNIPILDTFGTLRSVKLGKTYMTAVTFNAEEAANALGDYKAQSVYRWIRNGIFPPMKEKGYGIADGDPTFSVYTFSELEAIMRVMQKHQSQYKYLTKKHTETIHAIADAVTKVRKGGK